MASNGMIYFKNMSGDIVTLSYNPEWHIEEYRGAIAKHIQTNKEITSERIVIQSLDEEHTEFDIPSLIPDTVYGYFVRDEHSIYYNVQLSMPGINGYKYDGSEEYDTNIYYRYDVKIEKIPDPLDLDRTDLVEEFSIYYNPRKKVFYHENNIQILHFLKTGLWEDPFVATGKESPNLVVLAYEHLRNISWFDRGILGQVLFLKWHEAELYGAYDD